MLKVLIVEDDADIAALHAHFIRQDARFSAISLAADLAKARELVEIAAFDLVIVDNYLPMGWAWSLSVNSWCGRKSRNAFWSLQPMTRKRCKKRCVMARLTT